LTTEVTQHNQLGGGSKKARECLPGAASQLVTLSHFGGVNAAQQLVVGQSAAQFVLAQHTCSHSASSPPQSLDDSMSADERVRALARMLLNDAPAVSRPGADAAAAAVEVAAARRLADAHVAARRDEEHDADAGQRPPRPPAELLAALTMSAVDELGGVGRSSRR
jgi:hypothetical protein